MSREPRLSVILGLCCLMQAGSILPLRGDDTSGSRDQALWLCSADAGSDEAVAPAERKHPRPGSSNALSAPVTAKLAAATAIVTVRLRRSSAIADPASPRSHRLCRLLI